MIPPASEIQKIREQLDTKTHLDPKLSFSKTANILLATTDSEIRHTISELLQGYKINTMLATGLEEIKSAVAKNEIAACFCGFWLVDGTYRDVVRHLRIQSAEIPVVIVCEPACPHEYRDYLAALKIRAFDFLCYPYRRFDMERILHSAILSRDHAALMPT
jgi:DNA-binding NtrC family response regulator